MEGNADVAGTSGTNQQNEQQQTTTPECFQSATTYSRRGGTSGIEGQMYEIKLLMWFVGRALVSKIAFKLGCNLLRAEKFDDIVAIYKTKDANEREITRTICVQAKHIVNELFKKITLKELENSSDGKFSIKKYFKSYRDIKSGKYFKTPECGVVQYIIYTNIDVDKTIFVEVKDQDCDELIKSNGKIYRLNDNIITNFTTYTYKQTKHKDKMKEEFLRNLKFYVNQSNEKELDAEIKNIIKKLLQHEELKNDEIDQIFLNAQDLFKTYWGSKGNVKFLTENDNYFDDALQKLPRIKTYDNCIINWKQKIKEHNISHKEACIEELRSKMEGGSITNVVWKQTDEIFTVAKILQILKSSSKKYKMIDENSRNFTEKVLSDFQREKNVEVLLFVDEDSQPTKHQQKIKSILKSRNKQLIIISKEKCQLDEEMNVNVIEDTFNIEDLEDEFPNSLLNKKINFLGNENAVLKDLMDDKKYLDIELVNILLSNENLCIKSNLPELCGNYISRKIMKYDCISNNILSDDSSNDKVIIISSDDKEIKRNSDDELQENNENIIFTKDQENAEKSFNDNENSGNVHMLVSKNSKLKWVKSKGSMSLLRKHINLSETETFSEEEFITDTNNRKLVLISGSAGIGKSTLLSSIAGNIKDKKPYMWFIRFDNILDLLKSSEEKEKIIDVLKDQIDPNCKFESKMFSYCMERKNNITFVVDGLDEIIYSGKKEQEEIFSLLKRIIKTKCNKLIITSRRDSQNVLEDKFCTLSYIIKQFESEDKKDYLQKSWGRDIVEIPTHCDNKILGNPLLLCMFSQIYKLQDVVDAENLSVFTLYEEFVNLKLKLYMQHNFNIQEENPRLKYTMMFMQPTFIDLHIFLAMKLIFKTFDINEEFLGHDFSSVKPLIENVSTFGIVEHIHQKKVKFLHRTFAEYFIAKFIFYKLSQETGKNFQNFFINKILAGSNTHGIRKQLNENLANTELKNAHELRNLYMTLELTQTPLHIAARNNNYNIVNFIINLFSTLEDKKKIVNAQNEKKQTALHLASSAGHTESMEALIEAGAEVDTKDTREDTALTLACHSNKLNAVEILLKNGANVKTDRNGFTASHIAAKFGYIDIFKKLVEYRPDLHSEMLLFKKPMNVCDVAIRYKKWEIVKMILESKVVDPITLVESKLFNVNSRKLFADKLLFQTANHGNLDLVKLLYDTNSISDINERNINDETLLDIAALTRNWDMVEYLVSKGADYKESVNILFLAIANGELGILQFLHKRQAVFDLSYNGSTVIHKAVECREYEILKWLVEEADVAVNLKNENGDTILHTVDTKSTKDITKYLINKFQDINIRGKNGKTILQNVIRFDDMELIEMLLEKGAKVDEKDDFGNTVLHFSARSGNIELVKHFAQLPGMNLEDENDRKETLLHCAVKAGNEELVKYLIDEGIRVNAKTTNSVVALLYPMKNLNIALLLLDNGANIGDTDQDGNSILHFAARKGNVDVVDKLINRYSDDIKRNEALNLKNKLGLSVLARAIRSGNLELVEMLVKSGADVFTLDNEDNSLLHFASKGGNLEIIEFLINNKKLKVNHKNINDETMLHIAIKHGKLPAAKYYYHTHSLSLSDIDKDGNNALHLAAKYGKYVILNWILEIEIDLTEITVKNKENMTACEIDARIGCLEMVRTEPSRLESDVMTLLEISIKNGHLHVLQWLLKRYYSTCNIDENKLKSIAHEAEQHPIETWLKRTFDQ